MSTTTDTDLRSGHAQQPDTSTSATVAARLTSAAEASRRDARRLQEEADALRAEGHALTGKDSPELRDEGKGLIAEAAHRQETSENRIGMAIAYAKRAARLLGRG